jgi:hypothetical protein
MKTLRDLQLLGIVEGLKEYKAIDKILGMDLTLYLFDMICSAGKNIAVQSAATKLGMAANHKPQDAFNTGIHLLMLCEAYGLYKIANNEKNVWIVPLLNFEEEEHFILDPANFESHELPEEVNNNKGKLLSQFSKHNKPLNYDFLNKIGKIPFEIDMDILLNFQGKNMPITYNRVTAEYLNKPIYFEWDYDSRGRSYPRGYALNIHGNKTVRSVIQLKNKEVIKDIDPLYIALANARGFDDWTWERRIAWAKKQTVAESFIIPKGTKYPEKYAKTIRALLDYKDGNESGMLMELDATASGIQIMAAITGCMRTAKEVNLIDSKHRRDVYKSVAKKMSASIGRTMVREDIKYPTMTHYYNSLATPKEVFNPEELAAFYESINGMLPGAEFCMKELNKCWNPKAKYHSWVLPDGHTAFVRTMTSKERAYTYKDTEIHYQYYINEGNQTDFRSLVPNIIHSIDGYIVRQMILRSDFELIHVHDCFLFHPNHFKEVTELYRTILAELVTDYNINHIIKAVSGKTTNHKVDPKLADKILQSSYALS